MHYLLTNPLTWLLVVLGALLVIAAATTGEGLLSSLTVVGGVLVVTVLMTLMVVPGSDEDTFSTWAAQRYGIEIEALPEYEGLFFSGVETETTITLDDGTSVRAREVTDARGETAYLLAPAEEADAELPVIVK